MSYTIREDGRHVIVDERNRRIKVLGYAAAEIPALHARITEMACPLGVSKLIIYAKKRDVPSFTALGYVREGRIDGFFRGENAQMMSFFLTPERARSTAPELADEIVRVSQDKQGSSPLRSLPAGYTLREAGEADAEELAALYRLVFATYPTPMDDPAYVRQTMRTGTRYVVAEHGGAIVCAASAEVSGEFGSAELTDCATRPDHLGQGLLQPLFTALETRLQEQGIYYLYTLTRAQSPGMNVTAAKQGYVYRGRLVNNCTIATGFEDMNIWVKPLRETWE